MNGVGRLTLFVIRRNWVRMLVWALVIAVLVPIVVAYQQQTFPTQADRDAYAALVTGDPGLVAMTGLPYAAGTAGGILNIKLWMSEAIALALVCVFLVTRNGRAEEESGRAELIRSGAVGQHAYSLAAWLVTGGFAVVTGLLCALLAIASGLPADGSLLMGLSFSGVGIAFTGVSAIMGQLASTGRGANAWASIVVGLAYVVRAIADVQTATSSAPDAASALTWASPIGWAQQTRSFGENAWWPLALLVGFGAVAAAVALVLESRRDLGAGIVPNRAGAAHASPLTRTIGGLATRLQRNSLIGWSIGIVVGAALFGAIAQPMASLVDDTSTTLGHAVIGSAASALDGIMGFFLMAMVVLIGAFAVQSALSLRFEEAANETELQWTAAVSRVGWTLARVAIAAIASLALLALTGAIMGAEYGQAVNDASQAGRFAAWAVAYWPSLLVLIAAAVLFTGWLPRAATAITWAVYGVFAGLAVLGDIFGLPDDVVDNTLFSAVPRLGQSDPDWTPLYVIAAIAAVLGALGVWRMRTRDTVGA